MFEDELALADQPFPPLQLLNDSPVRGRALVIWRNVGWEAFRFFRSIRKWWASATHMCSHREAAWRREDLQSTGARY